jgi:DNA-binding PadR family transcriptional regulator
MVDAVNDDVRRLLPLSPQQFHILLSLIDAERHGYGIILEVERQTDGALRLGTGTLYTAIARLEQLGLIESAPRRRRPNDDPRRRYYRLTALGAAAVDAETERLQALVRYARRKGIVHAAPRAAVSRSK